jgi:hypothetical protein
VRTTLPLIMKFFYISCKSPVDKEKWQQPSG